MFFLLFFAVSSALSAKAMATDTPSDLAIMVPKLVKINQHLPTLSFVTLRLGNYLGECKIVCVNRYCMNLLYAPYWGKQR